MIQELFFVQVGPFSHLLSFISIAITWACYPDIV